MLNDRARDILAYVQRCQRERGIPPTIREIGTAFGISSTNGVRYYLAMLEKEGHLKRSSRISRGIQTSSSAHRQTGIPILGRVAAGEPILAEASFEGRLDTSDLFGETKELFALRVRGDSMIETGIFENDYVIVHKQQSAIPGEIVVALLEDEATVKYYQPRKDRIELVAANPKYDPIVVPKDIPFHILGVVRGIIRTLGR